MSKITRPQSEFKEFTPDEKRKYVEEQKRYRHKLAIKSREWIAEAGLAEKSLLNCGTKSTYKNNAVFKTYEDGTNTAEHIQHCKSKWSCPECSYLELWKSSQEIKKLLITLSKSKKYVVILQTLTAPHHPGQSLKNQMKEFSTAYSHFLNSGEIKKIKKEFNYTGNIRVYDHTVKLKDGKPDWHTHFHNLWIFETEKITDENCIEYQYLIDVMVEQWQKSHQLNFDTSRKVNTEAINHELVELSDDVKIVDYVAKVISTYITKTEKNEKGIYAPFDLLEGTPETEHFRKLCWLEYVQSVKGYKRINWSCGLKRKFPNVVYEKKPYDKTQTAKELLNTPENPSLFDNPSERICFAYYPSEQMLQILADDANAKAILNRALNTHDEKLLEKLLENVDVENAGRIAKPKTITNASEPDYEKHNEKYYRLNGEYIPEDKYLKMLKTGKYNDVFIEYFPAPQIGEQVDFIQFIQT